MSLNGVISCKHPVTGWTLVLLYLQMNELDVPVAVAFAPPPKELSGANGTVVRNVAQIVI